MTESATMAEYVADLLLVDDDEAKRYLMATWLRRAGHRVTEARTGREALSNVGAAELVLLDVHLPDMSGLEVCRLIKANPRTASTPVIQVSATAVEVADRAHGLTQGADAYLTDPSEAAELLATVTAVLRYSRARQRAERTAAMLTALVTVTLHVNAAETFDGLASAAAAGAAAIFSVPAVLILQMPDGQARRTSATPGSPGTVRRGGPPGLPDRIADRLLGPRAASAVATIGRDDWLSIVPDATLRAGVCVGVARTKPGKQPVVVAISREGITGEEDLSVLRQLAQSVALGVEALRSSAEEHLAALTLQRSFLPAALPEIPGVLMAFRYLPASDQAEVGGDFYEALPWRDGVLVAIGDVQGHSLHAATVMGELRHALRAFATEAHSPLAISGLINEVLRRYHPGIIATLCLAVLRPETGELSIVNCGHMPPLVLERSGGSYVGEGGIMLGLSCHEPHTETAFLPVGGTALLFTDGLVEDRRVLIDDNLEKLRAAALQAADADVETFANHVLTLLGSSEDDVAMIVLRRLGRAGRATPAEAGPRAASPGRAGNEQ
jgi:serine phosphatase RsbU (regulator of sigma subunit)/DNA-binding NarL/FixJ family response regulator